MSASVTLVVMSKYPEAGKVKTRLQPALSPEQAARIYREFLIHLTARLAEMNIGPLVLCHDPPDAGERFCRLLKLDGRVQLVPQSGGDLGQRISAAAQALGGRLLFLGVDSPDVPESHIREVAGLLERCEVAIGPCADGGYWGLGLSPDIDPPVLLSGIPWSSGQEAQATVRRAQELGYRTGLGSRWDDVDRAEDLERLIRRLATSSQVQDARLLNALGNIVAAAAEVN